MKSRGFGCNLDEAGGLTSKTLVKAQTKKVSSPTRKENLGGDRTFFFELCQRFIINSKITALLNRNWRRFPLALVNNAVRPTSQLLLDGELVERNDPFWL